jgi:hypothetical protein
MSTPALGKAARVLKHTGKSKSVGAQFPVPTTNRLHVDTVGFYHCMCAVGGQMLGVGKELGGAWDITRLRRWGEIPWGGYWEVEKLLIRSHLLL